MRSSCGSRMKQGLRCFFLLFRTPLTWFPFCPLSVSSLPDRRSLYSVSARSPCSLVVVFFFCGSLILGGVAVHTLRCNLNSLSAHHVLVSPSKHQECVLSRPTNAVRVLRIPSPTKYVESWKVVTCTLFHLLRLQTHPPPRPNRSDRLMITARHRFASNPLTV